VISLAWTRVLVLGYRRIFKNPYSYLLLVLVLLPEGANANVKIAQ
jgi:hypothetical protein